MRCGGNRGTANAAAEKPLAGLRVVQAAIVAGRTRESSMELAGGVSGDKVPCSHAVPADELHITDDVAEALTPAVAAHLSVRRQRVHRGFLLLSGVLSPTGVFVLERFEYLENLELIGDQPPA